MISRKKLIEVALPLDAINKASVRESYIYRGNPSAIHKWWAQRPLAAARAVIFAQMVDDPSAHPDLFPTEKKQEKERQRLFKVIEDLVLWENTANATVLQRAQDDADSRWAMAWFEQQGFAEGEFGTAETLSKAKNTSVAGMVEAGILASRGGKVRLLRPGELPKDWDPAADARRPAWEVVHHLIRVLETGGEGAAADLVAKLGSDAEVARELAYRLYTVCERKKRAAEALSYNALVQSWPEITRLARETGRLQEEQAEMFR